MAMEDKCRRIKREAPSIAIVGNTFNAFGNNLPLAVLKREMAYPPPPQPKMRVKKFRNSKKCSSALIYFIWGEYLEGVKHKPVVRYVGLSITPKTRLGSGHHAIQFMEYNLQRQIQDLKDAREHYPKGHKEINIINAKIHHLENDLSNNPLISVLYEHELPTPIDVAEAHYKAVCFPTNVINTETKKALASLNRKGEIPDELNLLAADQLMDFPRRKLNED